MGELQRGVVKWFNDAKGFGFIEHETGRDVFVHYSVIEQDGFKTLKDGEEVNYELREGDKGLNASRVFRVVTAESGDSVTEEKSRKSEPIAPNLETGSVNTISKPASSMIEVENTTGTDAVGMENRGIAAGSADSSKDSEGHSFS